MLKLNLFGKEIIIFGLLMMFSYHDIQPDDPKIMGTWYPSMHYGITHNSWQTGIPCISSWMYNNTGGQSFNRMLKVKLHFIM